MLGNINNNKFYNYISNKETEIFLGMVIIGVLVLVLEITIKVGF